MIGSLIKYVVISGIVIICMVKIQNSDLVTDKNKTLQSAVENGFQRYVVDKFNSLTLTKND